MKRCPRCEQTKRWDDFYRNRRWRDGFHPYCKPCLLAYQRDRRRERLDAANPERQRWSRDFVRHDYFSTLDTPVKAYLAGLIAADGNLLRRPRRLSLELSMRDAELVQLMRDELAPGYPTRSRTRRGREYAVFAITSGRVCADLERLGITPRKSLTLRWPRLADDMARPFLLGYFDGDGYITLSRTGRYTYGRWGLIGTADFLAGAMRFIAASTDIKPRAVRASKGRIAQLHISGTDALAVDEWLHRGSIGLKRKRLRELLTHEPEPSDAGHTLDGDV